MKAITLEMLAFLAKREKELKEKREELEGKISSMPIPRAESSGDRMEHSFRASEAEKNSSMCIIWQKALKAVEGGLEALRNGTYHVCITCGGSIEMERMKSTLFPEECTKCMCKEKKEKKRT